jgi:hypothetical protein
VSDTLTLLRGIDKNGDTIVFLDGELDQSALEKVVKQWAGDPLGEPAIGTAATPVAKLNHYLEFLPVDDGEVVTVQGKAEEAAPEPEPNEEMVAINKAIVQRGVEFFAKAEVGDEGIAVGIVLEPTAKDDGTPVAPDTQNDVYTKQDVEKAAYVWLLNGGAVDLLHSWQELGKEEILGIGASDITHGPCEFTKADGTKQKIAEGTWLVTTVWNTNGTVWPKIKDNTLGAYSIGGTAQQEPVNQPEA